MASIFNIPKSEIQKEVFAKESLVKLYLRLKALKSLPNFKECSGIFDGDAKLKNQIYLRSEIEF